MTTSRKATVTLPTDTQIHITREFDAPRHLVYKAYTTPELVKKWWSAKRGAVTIAEIDLRVGGQWRFVMIADGGFEVGFHGVYREIVPNERLVSTEAYEGIPNPDDNASLNTLTLAEKKGRTLLTVICEYGNQQTRDMVIESGMEGGMQDAFDLLEEVAESIS